MTAGSDDCNRARLTGVYLFNTAERPHDYDSKPVNDVVSRTTSPREGTSDIICLLTFTAFDGE